MKNFLFLVMTFVFVSCQSDYLVMPPSKQLGPIPAAFTVTTAVQGHEKITLSWDPSPGADTYIVKYGTVSGSYPTVASINASSPFEVDGLTIGTEYFFMVTAVNSHGVQDATTEINQEAIFYDDFSQLQLGTLWQLSTSPTTYMGAFSSDPTISITSDGNELIFGETLNMWTGLNLETLQDFNLTDAWVSTEISMAPLDDGLRFREGGLWIINSASNGWEIFVYNGYLYAGTFLSDYSGNQNPKDTPYDPINHRFVRIRHQSIDERIYFETSADGDHWVTFRSLPVDVNVLPYTRLHLMLYTYTSHETHGNSGIPLVKFNEFRSNAPVVP